LPGHDLDLLIDAAREAGRIAMAFWKRDAQVWDKADGAGPVTEADLAVNAMLVERLRIARPNYGWLSEETPDSVDRLACDWVFIVDPIDGTRAFIAGEDTFSHSLAVAHQGRIVAGVVYLPVLDRMYAASADGPATRNGVEISASKRDSDVGANLLVTRPNMAPELWPGGVPDVKRSFRPSIAYRMCLAAEGRHDGMLTLAPTWEWDIAAGALIAERAGAVVTDRRGAQLRFNSVRARADGVVMAGAGVHAGLMKRLGAAPPP
jgi:myo-inositol-1(or 4)-monophosphatase